MVLPAIVLAGQDIKGARNSNARCATGPPTHGCYGSIYPKLLGGSKQNKDLAVEHSKTTIHSKSYGEKNFVTATSCLHFRYK